MVLQEEREEARETGKSIERENNERGSSRRGNRKGAQEFILILFSGNMFTPRGVNCILLILIIYADHFFIYCFIFFYFNGY